MAMIHEPPEYGLPSKILREYGFSVGENSFKDWDDHISICGAIRAAFYGNPEPKIGEFYIPEICRGLQVIFTYSLDLKPKNDGDCGKCLAVIDWSEQPGVTENDIYTVLVEWELFEGWHPEVRAEDN